MPRQRISKSLSYKFENPDQVDKIEMPGLWFSEKEATALVLMQHLLSSLDQGGLIGPHIEPLTAIIDGILGQSETSAKELRKRIKVIGMGSRKNSIENFSEIGAALLKRNRLEIDYYSKGKGEDTKREIRLTPDGRLIDRWPGGFFNERYKDLFDDE